MNYRYIIVEGSTSSGESELSRQLAKHFEVLRLAESPECSPFLERFYLNALNHGLVTELSFPMRCAENVDIINMGKDKGGHVIADFLLEKGQIFVPVALKDPEQTLFWESRRKIMPQYPVPDLVMYPQTSGEADTKRLQRRGDGTLSMFLSGYLGKVQQEYGRFFHLYQNASLLIVGADGLDFTGNDEHPDMLLQVVSGMQGSHRYLNLHETV